MPYKLTKLQQRILDERKDPNDVWLIDCNYCGKVSYYNQGFGCGCEHCDGDIAQWSDEMYTLTDLWDNEARIEMSGGLP